MTPEHIERWAPVSLPPSWASGRLDPRWRRWSLRFGLIGVVLLVLGAGVLCWATDAVRDRVTTSVFASGEAHRGLNGKLDSIELWRRTSEPPTEFVMPPDWSPGPGDWHVAFVELGLRTGGEGRFAARERETRARVRVRVTEYEPDRRRAWRDEVKEAARAEIGTWGVLSEAEYRVLQSGGREKLPTIYPLMIAEYVLEGAVVLGAVMVACSALMLMGLLARRFWRAWFFGRDPLKCRRCGYGLAGLQVGTRGCPECGVRLYPSRGTLRNLPR